MEISFKGHHIFFLQSQKHLILGFFKSLLFRHFLKQSRLFSLSFKLLSFSPLLQKMHLTEHNIVEKIQHAFEENDNKAIAKTTRFVADNLADTVRNPHWKRLSADVRAHVLEKAILYKDAEKEEESSESDSGRKGGFDKLDINLYNVSNH